MGFREVSVVEVREVLRGWLEGAGLRKAAERAGVDRKTARRYVEAAQAEGLVREDDIGALTDELIGAVVTVVRPARPNGHGASWEILLGWEEQICGWVAGAGPAALSIVKIEEQSPSRTSDGWTTAERRRSHLPVPQRLCRSGVRHHTRGPSRAQDRLREDPKCGAGEVDQPAEPGSPWTGHDNRPSP